MSNHETLVVVTCPARWVVVMAVGRAVHGDARRIATKIRAAMPSADVMLGPWSLGGRLLDEVVHVVAPPGDHSRSAEIAGVS